MNRAALPLLVVLAACQGAAPPAPLAPAPPTGAATGPAPPAEPAPPVAPELAPPRPAPAVVAPEPSPIEPSSEPPSAPPDPAVGLAPPAVRWSGLRVLYLVHPGHEARWDEPAVPPHAVPVACTDGRRWLPLGDGCGERPAGTLVRFEDGSTARLGRRVNDPTWGHWMRALSRIPEGAELAVHASPGAPSGLRRVACVAEASTTFAPFAGEPLADARATCAPIRDGLERGVFGVREALRLDFDGDGTSDRLLRLSTREAGLGHVSLTVLERAGTSVLLEVYDGRYLPGQEPCADEPGPLFLEDSVCFDLDADGRVELFGTYRGDSEREYELIELGERDERIVAGGIAFGD